MITLFSTLALRICARARAPLRKFISGRLFAIQSPNFSYIFVAQSNFSYILVVQSYLRYFKEFERF